MYMFGTTGTVPQDIQATIALDCSTRIFFADFEI